MIRRNLATLLTVISISANAQSLQELQKMKTEYEKIKNEQMNLPAQSIGQTGLNNLGLPTEAEIISNFELQKNNNDSLDFNLKYFGYDFFSKRDTINFWENLPTPKNYQLGPGDELIISIWGETQLRQTYIIDRDGNIYDEKIGLVSMIGHSLTTAEALLMKKFATIFSTLKIKNSSSYLNLSIGKLKSINVSFVGEVNYPGIYSIHPFSSLITGLIQAGGVDTTGTLRRIKIKRYDNKSKVINFDFYDYLLNGDISDEIQLRDKDVVLVSPRLSTITVDSAVFRPGIYEFLNGENLKQIVDFSGGLKPDASTTIGIERIKPFSQRNKSEEIRYNLYNEYSSLNKLKAQNGDFLTVHYLNKNVNKVEIIGKEDKPISFLYYKGMTLHDLIEISKIFYDKSFLSSVYQNKAEIARRDPLTRYEKIITVNLGEIINNREIAKSIPLNNLDRFILNRNSNFIDKDFIKIGGEVVVPGSYPLIEDQENLKTILKRAGGLTKNALSNGISIYRKEKYFSNFIEKEKSKNNTFFNDIEYSQRDQEEDSRLRVAWKNENITLMPGDSIIVKQKTGTIYIEGEVYNPGILEYQKNKPLRHYVNSAGGVTNLGDNKNIIVVYANGVVSPKKWYSSPTIKDGSMIIVNTKENQQPFNITQFATNWTSILSSLITAVILSQSIGSNS